MAQLRFDGKVALVTGAAGGVGRTHALMLAERGAKVVVNDLGVAIGSSAPAARTVVDEILAAGGEAVADNHDVLDGGEAVRAAVDAFGRLDVVINNAGVAAGGPIADPAAADQWDRTIATTLHGSIAVTRAAWPHLVAAGGGRVVMTASQAMFGAPSSGAYSSAKSAMYGLTKSLDGEGRSSGIAVNCVMPAAWTRLTALLPPSPLTALLESDFPPEAVSSLVVWLCHPDCPMAGEVFSVGGGRAGRVFLAETSGARVAEHTPEAWVGTEGQLLDMAEFGVPRDMVHEVGWQTRNLGRDVPPEYQDGGSLAW
jgi:NAD(P)-dependent dehydrogenase (short-subunit alcohol dehydrogenase family)